MASEKVLCELCNSEFVDLEKHVKSYHKLEGMDEYDKKVKASKPSITPDERTEGIWENEKKRTDFLKEFLAEYGITEEELRMVVSGYVNGSGIPASQSIYSNQERGKKFAEEVKDQPTVNTNDLYTAECLTKEYGFVCKDVRKTDKGKSWFLEKQ